MELRGIRGRLLIGGSPINVSQVHLLVLPRHLLVLLRSEVRKVLPSSATVVEDLI